MPADQTPEEQVDALMATIDDLGTLAADSNANEKIHRLVLRLGIFIGLDFEEWMRGKRPIHALRRGVIAFGEDNLPVRIHGHHRAGGLPATNQGGASPDEIHDNQAAPACCRGPSVESGAQGGDGTGNFRTDEPDSGMEQSRTRSNVGATGFEPATSTSRT